MMKRIDYLKRYLVGFYSDLNFKWKFIITYTPLICIIILTSGLTTYNLSMNRMMKDEKDLMLSHLNEIRMLIDLNLGMYLKESEILFYNTHLQEALSASYESGMGDSVDALKGLYKLIDPVFQDMYIAGENITLRDTLDSGKAQVRIYTNNSTIPIDMALTDRLESIAEEPWVKALYTKPGLMSWDGLSQSGSSMYFSFNRVLKNFKTNDQLGIMSIRIPVSKLEYLVNGGYQIPNFAFYFEDNNNNFVPLTKYDQSIVSREIIEEYKKTIGIKSSWIGDIEFESGQYLVANERLQNSGFHIIGIANYNVIQRKLAPIRYTIIFILVVGAGASILFSFIVASLLSRRIERFRSKMSALMESPAAQFKSIGGKDEIGTMDRSFDNLISILREAHTNEERHRHFRTALQMELLQARINPHLLYNTMAAISWNARKSGNDEIRIVSDELIRFYKHFLNHGVMISRVSDEISMVENYANIMKFTYNLQFDMKVLVSDEAKACYCPNLFLQPIVENAIIHGIRTKEQSGGKLSICGHIETGRIFFNIIDDGVGMSTEQVKEIFKDKEPATGYGLANIRKRLSLYYGDRLEMKIFSEEGMGCEVSITVPVLTFEQLDALIRYEED